MFLAVYRDDTFEVSSLKSHLTINLRYIIVQPLFSKERGRSSLPTPGSTWHSGFIFMFEEGTNLRNLIVYTTLSD